MLDEYLLQKLELRYFYLLQLVIDWVKQDPDFREDLLSNVLSHVRLPLVDPYFLFDKVDNERLLTKTVDARMLIDEAKKYFILKVINIAQEM